MLILLAKLVWYRWLTLIDTIARLREALTCICSQSTMTRKLSFMLWFAKRVIFAGHRLICSILLSSIWRTRYDFSPSAECQATWKNVSGGKHSLSCPSNIMYHTFTFFPSIRRLLSHFQSVTAARLAAWSDNEIMNIMSPLSSSSSSYGSSFISCLWPSYSRRHSTGGGQSHSTFVQLSSQRVFILRKCEANEKLLQLYTKATMKRKRDTDVNSNRDGDCSRREKARRSRAASTCECWTYQWIRSKSIGEHHSFSIHLKIIIIPV